MKPFISVLILFLLAEPHFAQWSKAFGSSDLQVICLDTNGTNLFAGTCGNGIFLSSDNGLTWHQCNSGLSTKYIESFEIHNKKVFVGTDEGVFLSTNDGISWTGISNGFPDNPCVRAIKMTDSNIYAGTYHGIFISSDNGASWNSSSNGLPINSYDKTCNVYSIVVHDSSLLAGTWLGIYKSIDNGKSWSLLSEDLNSILITDITVFDQNIFAGTFQGVYISSNNGLNWVPVNSNLTGTSLYVKSFKIYNNYLFISTFNGVYFSTDYGETWNDANYGFPSNPIVNSLAISGNFLFAATNNQGVWKRSLSDIITSIEDVHSEINYKYELRQNYPNPFNPITYISFSVPQSSFVTLKVYDILGKEVATLVNEKKPAGDYQVKFDGSRLTSGIYFYQFHANNFIETKKLTLLK